MDLLGSIAFTSSIATLLLCWVVALATRRRSRGRTALLILSSIFPPALVTAVLLCSQPRLTDLRIALEGARFRMAELGEPILVGGSRADDHLVLSGLPPGFLRFTLDGEAVRIDLSDPDDTTSDLFGVVRVGGRRPFHNAVALDSTATIRVGNGDSELAYDGRTQTFRTAGSLAGAEFPRLPTRRDDTLNLPLGRERPAEDEIFPLRYFGTPGQTGELPGRAGAPLGAFACRDGGYRRTQVFAVLTSPGESVTVGGKTVSFEPVVARVANKASVELSLFRVRALDPRTARPKERSRVEPRGQLIARYENGELSLVFSRPFFVRVPRAHLDMLARKRPAVPAVLSIVTSRDETTQAGPVPNAMLLALSPLGEPMAPELFGNIAIEADSFAVVSHTGRTQLRYGDGLAVGQDAAALLRVFRFRRPDGLLALVWIASGVSLLAGLGLRRRLLDWVFLSGTEMLLALRLLIGFEGAFLDPSSAAATWRSLAAYAAVPFFLQATLASYLGIRRGVAGWAHGLTALAAGALALKHGGSGPLEALALVAMLAGAPVLVGRGLFRGLLPFLRTAVARLRSAPESPGRPFTKWLLVGSTVAVLVRFLLAFAFGMRERAELFGFRLAISVVYTPVVLGLFALVWLWAKDRGFSWQAAWKPPVLIVVLLGFPAFLVHDWGLLLLYTTPIAALFLVPVTEDATQARAALAAPFAAAVLFFALLRLWPALGLSPRAFAVETPTGAAASRDAKAAEDLLSERMKARGNQLRIWEMAAPERLRELGTTEAESLAVVMETVTAYARRGPFGQGYLAPPLASAVRRNHLDDNLSAVHVLAPFGFAGGAALLLLPAAWVGIPLVALAERARNAGQALTLSIGAREALGLLIGLTFFFVAFYMFGANTALVLFTGKNVYLLAAESLSDLAEGTLLVALALWAFRRPSLDPTRAWGS